MAHEFRCARSAASVGGNDDTRLTALLCIPADFDFTAATLAGAGATDYGTFAEDDKKMTTGIVLLTLLALLVFRIPVAAAMIASATLGFFLLDSLPQFLVYLKTSAFWQFSSYDLSVVPLFILMGQCAARSGLSSSLFRAARVMLGHRHGGVAMASIVGCAGFAAMCGSSLATASTMGRIALPELLENNYDGGFSAATLAIGGTLGILIPPSLVLVIFAIITEANIAKLFIAALVPGIIAMLLYIFVVWLYARRYPLKAPRVAALSFRERRAAALRVFPALLTIFVVIGGLYLGLSTPTEAAALGTLLVCIHFVVSRRFTGISSDVVAIFSDTARASAMIFLILLAADLLSSFLSLAGFPQAITRLVIDSELTPYSILLLSMLLLLVLGCFLDSLSIIVLTMPLLWPALSGLGFGMDSESFQLWFGVLSLILVEMGLITPPVGLNCLIIHRLSDGIALRRIFSATLPFLGMDVVRIAMLLLFPQIVLFLPRLMSH